MIESVENSCFHVRNIIFSLFQISSRDNGKLIGKGGSTIRDLRQKSGCQIELGEGDDRETDVYVYGRTRVTLSKNEFVTIGFDFGEK